MKNHARFPFSYHFNSANLTGVTLNILPLVLGLNIPKISYAIIVIAGLFYISIYIKNLIRFGNNSKINIHFCLSLVLLIGFSWSYYPIIYYHNLARAEDLIYGLSLPVASYIVGFSSIKIKKYTNFSILIKILSSIGGGVLFVLLSSILHPEFTSTINIDSRSLPNLWSSETPNTNGTVLDLYSMMGMALIPSIFLKRTNELTSTQTKILFFLISLLFFSSAYLSFLLQGRKPWLALLLSTIIMLLFSLYRVKNQTQLLKILLLVLVSGLSMFLGMLLFGQIQELLFSYGLFNRFQAEGLESGRYEVWNEILSNAPRNLWGGRSFQLYSARFAHNIWLDSFYDGGIIPAVLLFIFNLSHISCILRMISDKDKVIISSIVTLIASSLFLGFQSEPVLQASFFFFSFSCYFFGIVMKISYIHPLKRS